MELSNKNPTVEIVGKYIDANTKTQHHCLVHDVYWNTTPSRALQGVGCELCRKQKFKKIRTRSNSQYIDLISKANIQVLPLEPYIDAKTPILHKCTIHNYEWMASPDNILHNHGCPKCGNEKIGTKNSISHDEYVKRLKELNPNIKVMEAYKGMSIPIWHKCLIDDYKWYATPVNCILYHSCPKCNKRNVKRNKDMYISDLSIVNSDVELIGEYIDVSTYALHKCKVCGHEWDVVPTSLLCGTGCPVCRESHGERQIRLWLEKHDIAYERQKKFEDCKNIRPLHFDFYLPKENILIEYDGEQHFRSVDLFGGEDGLKKRLQYDSIKNNYCKNNNIPLLRIPYNKDVATELNNFLFA